MSAILDTSAIPVRDREETLRHAIWETVVRVELDHHLPPPNLSAKVALDTIGCIGICSALSTSITVRRTPQLAREDTEPFIFLGLQMSSTSMVVQQDRQALLRPGDFVLYDTSMPYTLLFEEGADQHFFRFPRSMLALPDRALREVTAVTLGRDNGVAALASAFFAQFAASEELRNGQQAAAVTEPSIELVRAAVATRLGDSNLARAPLEATVSLQIKNYIRTHLRDHDLSAARIAAAHNISVRHLYTLLARSEISLGDWIRSLRLQQCRRELADPRARYKTIAAIGHSWGFADPTHFSKVFKATYGMSPRVWRNSSLNAPSLGR
ncbi:helix-turn-helix domain-containing protein [Streptomyces hiroshimensis]